MCHVFLLEGEKVANSAVLSRSTVTKQLHNKTTMPEQHRGLKHYLNDLAGLRFPPGGLFEAEGDSLLFVVRMTRVHASRTPYERLDKDMVHNKCLEIMENCHAKRDMLLGRHRMDDQFWEEI